MTALAELVLAIHLLWILGVIFGAIWTRGRRVWSGIHILALLWGIAVEAGPWPCPLTLAEQYFETKAGVAAYLGSFVLHYLDAVVYPNVPDWVLTWAGVAVCGMNLGIYGYRTAKFLSRRRTAHQCPDEGSE